VDGAKKYTEKAYQLWYNYENKQNWDNGSRAILFQKQTICN
jgi:hypothetical protein